MRNNVLMPVSGPMAGTPLHQPYAGAKDYWECRRLHRAHGKTYYFATRLFPSQVRLRTHALYGFVRLADEIVDNPTGHPCEDLEEFRSQLRFGLDGIRPSIGVLRAFCDVVHECQIPLQEPFIFLDAMAQDLEVNRYQTYGELRDYMRGSASSVGLMMCAILDADRSQAICDAAMSLGEAMQLTNFLRDVGEDLARGRIYLPLEDIESFDLTEQEILEGEMSDRFVRLMRFEIERARALYRQARVGIGLLPTEGKRAVLLALTLYSRILDRIEDNQYQVFTKRARTSTLEKLLIAAKVFGEGFNSEPECRPRPLR